MLGTALEGDRFAMAYVHPDDVTEQRFIRLRVIDPDAVKNPYSQEFDVDKGELVHKMVYLKGVGTVDLIVEEPTSSRFFQLKPSTTSSYNSIFFELGGAFRRIRAKDAVHFISSYGNQFYIDDRTAHLPHSDQSCPANNDRFVDIIPNIPPVNAVPVGGGSYHLITTNSTDAVQTHAITTDCFSFELDQ